MTKRFVFALFLTVSAAVNCFGEVPIEGNISKAQISVNAGELRVNVKDVYRHQNIWVKAPLGKILIRWTGEVMATEARCSAEKIVRGSMSGELYEVKELIILVPTKDLMQEWQDRLLKVLERLRNPLPEIVE